jgi:hypothetical protein
MASAFKTAFAQARKAGKKEFTFEGKSYNTELKETVRPKARGAAVKGTPPMPRPVTAAAGKGPAGAAVSVVAPKPRPGKVSAESEGKAHLGRNRPMGKKKRGQ